MNRSIKSLLAITTLSLFVACGGEEPEVTAPDPIADEGDDVGGADPGDPEPQGDIDAPTLVSTAPENAATAVDANQLVVLRFSEPMDKQSVIDAYTSELLPLDEVNLQFNDAGDVLNITPIGGLAYAEGDKDVDALSYAVSIGETATDLAGNALAQPAMVSFDTLRHITLAIPAVPELTGYVMNGGFAQQGDVSVGDQEILNNVSEARGLVTFDLTDVPDATDFESVTVRAPQLLVNGDPQSGMGALHIESVWYDAVDQWAFSAEVDLAGAVLEPAGNEIVTWSADLATTVIDDIDNRVVRKNLSQYRLRFLDGPDADGVTDRLQFGADAITLEVVYLAE